MGIINNQKIIYNNSKTYFWGGLFLPNRILNEVINNSINYLKKRNSDLIKFKYTPHNHIIYSKINKTLFEWVIENIVKNSIDSMGGTGNISIKIGNIDNEIQIVLRDEGKGIPEKNYKKIFESGFSSKKKGWGLGLSLSKRIISLYHGGKIFVKDSKIGEGTAIEIRLPVFKESS